MDNALNDFIMVVRQIFNSKTEMDDEDEPILGLRDAENLELPAPLLSLDWYCWRNTFGAKSRTGDKCWTTSTRLDVSVLT